MQKEALLKFFEEIRKTCSKALGETLNSGNKRNSGDNFISDLFNEISKKIEAGKEILSPEALKLALSYREFSCESITFKELVSIVKREFTLSQGMSICVLKTEKENKFHEFDIMACSSENEILFSATCPWCHVIVAIPDPELVKMFGEKSMLVLK